jgi:hypothetical protein
MIEQIPGLTDDTVCVRASGKLRDADFVMLFALIDAAVADRGKIRLLIELHDFRGWDLHGLWDDLKFHTTRSANIERIAYVGDKTWEKWLINMARVFPGTAIRYFDASEMDAVRAWLALNTPKKER